MAPLSFGARFFFAFVAFFRILFDGAFAARALAVKDATDEAKALPAKSKPPEPDPARDRAQREHGAAMLLSLLQREGRLVDFAEQDIAKFSDADVGAAARVVHDGCKKVLDAHAKVSPIRHEPEGARVTLEKVDAGVSLEGSVSGKAPYSGTLVHKGWRATRVSLPEPVEGHDASVIAAARVEL